MRLMDGSANHGWRWEMLVALVCAAFLPAWVYFAYHRTQTFAVIVLGIVLGIGLGCGAAGVRRGRLASRLLSGSCLAVMFVVAITFIASVRLDLTGQR